MYLNRATGFVNGPVQERGLEERGLYPANGNRACGQPVSGPPAVAPSFPSIGRVTPSIAIADPKGTLLEGGAWPTAGTEIKE